MLKNLEPLPKFYEIQFSNIFGDLHHLNVNSGVKNNLTNVKYYSFIFPNYLEDETGIDISMILKLFSIKKNYIIQK